MTQPPSLRDGRFEILIETDGRLPLPAELVRSLDLEPGDIVGLKPVAGSWSIRFYREVLTYRWEFAPGSRWWFTQELLRLPLAALDENGAIVVPPDVLRLREGDRRILLVTMSMAYRWPWLDLIGGD